MYGRELLAASSFPGYDADFSPTIFRPRERKFSRSVKNFHDVIDADEISDQGSNNATF